MSRKRGAVTAVSEILFNLTSVFLIVVAAFNFDDTTTFVKLIGWLAAVALIEIAGEIRDFRKAVEK